MTGSVRVRKSGPALPEDRVREEVLVMRELDKSSEKLP